MQLANVSVRCTFLAQELSLSTNISQLCCYIPRNTAYTLLNSWLFLLLNRISGL